MTQAKSAPLDETALREAALAYVARYGGTGAAVARALDRRIRRWAEGRLSADEPDRDAIAAEVARLRAAADQVVASLAEIGAVSDRAFADSRARRLRRSGRSRRAVLAHLAARGVDAGQAAASAPEDEAAELAAALAFARRRRVGPFAATAEEMPAEAMARVLAAFGRAGFTGVIARRALACERAEAEAILLAQRQATP